jgi:hypothetical protein
MLDLASGTVLTLDGHPHTLYKEPQVTYPIPLLSPAISWAKSTFSIRQAAEYNMMRARENPEEGGEAGEVLVVDIPCFDNSGVSLS